MELVPPSTKGLSPSRGQVLSRRFRLIRPMSDDLLGTVHEAEPLSGGARVAVSLLHFEYAADARVAECFTLEARRVQKLIHPAVVRTFEVLRSEEGVPYIVSELFSGATLSQCLAGGIRVAASEAVAIVTPVLSALEAGHAQNIPHHNLKPSNILLVPASGGSAVVKVAGFGAAPVMAAAGIPGTSGYRAPEQITGIGPVDTRADLWSVGVILYELLTGRLAFPAPTEFARGVAITKSEPTPLEQIDPSLAPFASIVRRALKKNARDRFLSPTEMLDAIRTTGISPTAITLCNMALAPQSLAPPSLAAPDSLGRYMPPPTLTRSDASADIASSVPAESVRVPSHVETPRVRRAMIDDKTLPSSGLPIIPPSSSGVPQLKRAVSLRWVMIVGAIALTIGLLFGLIVGR